MTSSRTPLIRVLGTGIGVWATVLVLHVAAAYRRLGVDQMIPKPVFPSVLRQMIAALFAD